LKHGAETTVSDPVIAMAFSFPASILSDLMIVSDEVDPTNLLWGFSRSRYFFKNSSGKNDEGVI